MIRFKGVLAGLLLSAAVAVPVLQSRASIVDPSLISSSLVKAALVTSTLIGDGAAAVVADFFNLNLSSGTIYPSTTETVTTSFTRASVSSITDVHYREGVQINSGEVPFVGMDRIENLVSASEDMSVWTGGFVAAATVTATTIEFTNATAYYIRRHQGILAGTVPAGTMIRVSVTLSSTDKAAVGLNIDQTTGGGTNSQISLTSTPTRYSTIHTVDTDTTMDIGLDNRISHGGDGTTSGTITATNWMIEDVTGKPNKAPGQYVSVGVGVQDVTTAALLDLDNGGTDAGVTWDGVTQTATFTGPTTGQVYTGTTTTFDGDSQTNRTVVVTGEITAHTSGNFRIVYGGGSSTQVGSAGQFTLVATGTTEDRLRLGSVSFAGTVRIDSVFMADHGANIDGVRYSPYHNPRYVDSNNVVQNDDATGELISSGNNRFAVVGEASSDFYSQADAAVNTFTNSLYGWVYVAPENWSGAGALILINKPASYIFRINSSGGLQTVTYSSGAETKTSTSSVSFADGEGGWVGFRFDGDNNDLYYYTSTAGHYATFAEVEAAKTQLGTTVTSSHSSLDDSASDLRIGELTPTARLYKAFLSDNSATTGVTFDANDTTGWTANGNAYISTPPDPAIRISEARTNLLVNSRFDAAGTGENGVVVVDDQIQAPDGGLAARVDVTAGGATHIGFWSSAVTTTVDTDYVYYAVMKDDGAEFASIIAQYSTPSWAAVVANLRTGTITQTSTGTGTTTLSDSGIARLADGWVLVWMAVQDSVNTSLILVTQPNSTGTPTLGFNNGREFFSATAGEDYYVAWGQVEQGSYPTGYIKTEGSAVARNADVLSYSGLSGLSAHSVFAKGSLINSASSKVFVRVDDETSSNYSELRTNVGGTLPRLLVIGSSSTVASINGTTTINEGDVFELGSSVSDDDFELYVGGLSEGTPDTSGSAPVGLTRVNVGHAAGAVTGVAGYEVIKLFNTRLSDAEQEALAQ